MSNCTSRWAEVYHFAGFWCLSSIVTGTDNSGGAANAFLTDSTKNFPNLGIRANVGMILYNLTADTSGPVTAVTTARLTATGVTWDDGDSYRIVALDGAEIATVELYLDIAASDIHAALAANGACDCVLADWALGFLQKLNVIDAAAYYQCPCAKPVLSDEMRGRYLDWMSMQLDLIRTGQLELCAGETGSDFPAVGWAEQGLTVFNTAKIISNYDARNG